MIQFVCFSRNRPLQLHGYLSSMLAQFVDLSEVAMAVLARVEPMYETAYAELMAEFPRVTWIREGDFAADLLSLVDSTPEPYWCFGCDDDVWVEPVWPRLVIERAFKQDPELLGFSFRLGMNVKHGMWGNPMEQPRFLPGPYAQLVWDVQDSLSVGDWAYPWEVLGTVYRTEFVQRVLAGVPAPMNPSQLEAYGAGMWRLFTKRTHMAAMQNARLVVPTINVVQSEFPNGVVGQGSIEPELLLRCWQQGLRLDTKQFAQHQYTSWRIPDFYLKRFYNADH